MLACKSDDVADIKVMVECKAWNRPIEKGEVSKVDYVMGDLGFNKAIIVSLAGWRIGAETAANMLGIGLWDAIDLEKRLGRNLVAELKGGLLDSNRLLFGPTPKMTAEKANNVANRQRGGLLNREVVDWVKLIFVPTYRLQVRVSRLDKTVFGRLRATTRTVTNDYDGLSGLLHRFGGSSGADVEFGEIASSIAVPACRSDRQVRGKLEKECERWKALVNAAARARQASVLTAMGIPLDHNAVKVDSVIEVWWPFYVAMLKQRAGTGGTERLVALDAVAGKRLDTMTKVLNAHLAHVRDSVPSG